MPGSRLKKRPSVDTPVSSQSKAMSSPSSPEPKLRSPREPYPMPSSNPASQYTLMEKLGTGSFGTVYKAMHNETKQIVAVKQIGASHASWLLCHPSLMKPLFPCGSSLFLVLRSRRLGRRYFRNTAGNCQFSSARVRIRHSLLWLLCRRL
jgi:Protein kinase domain